MEFAFGAIGFTGFTTQGGLHRFDGKDSKVLDTKFDDVTSGSFGRLGKLLRMGRDDLWIISKGDCLKDLA